MQINSSLIGAKKKSEVYFNIFRHIFIWSHYILHKGIRKATSKGHEAGIHLFIVVLNYVQCVGYGKLGLGFVAIWVSQDFPSHQTLGVCFFSSFFATLLQSAKKHKLFFTSVLTKRGILK
jgi:hypothetical protein